MSKIGVFWVIDDDNCGKALIAEVFREDAMIGISKSGNNYNHRLLWDYIKPHGCNKPYDYYPRGRAELSKKGKPIIYMNKNIDESFLELIIARFELDEIPKIHYDGSKHYKCYLD